MYRCNICTTVSKPGQSRLVHRVNDKDFALCVVCMSRVKAGCPISFLLREQEKRIKSGRVQDINHAPAYEFGAKMQRLAAAGNKAAMDRIAQHRNQPLSAQREAIAKQIAKTSTYKPFAGPMKAQLLDGTPIILEGEKYPAKKKATKKVPLVVNKPIEFGAEVKTVDNEVAQKMKQRAKRSKTTKK